MSQLHQKRKTTTVYVIHDQVDAMTMADRIVQGFAIGAFAPFHC